MRPYALILALSPSAARLINITIDDTYGDPRTGQIPQYKSDVPWKARSADDGCSPSECSAQLDGNRVHSGTWHDKMTVPTAPPANVTINFNGTKVYAFCVLVNDIGISIQDTRLQFHVDGALADSFLHIADLTTDVYLYDQLVFQSQSLPLGNHELQIVNTATPDRFHGSLVLFDYVIYTTEEDDPRPSPPATSAPPPASISLNTGPIAHSSAPPSSDAISPASSPDPSSTLAVISGASTTPSPTPRASQKSINLGAVVGGAVGGVTVVAALLLFGIYVLARRRRRDRATARPAPDVNRQHHGLGDLDPFDDQAHVSPFLLGTQSSKGQPRSDIADTGASLLKSEDPTESVRASTAATGEELRREMERIRSEVEILKQAVGPPRYTAPNAQPNASLQT